ncbi:beta strand repeat-containing protein [Eionea flava]
MIQQTTVGSISNIRGEGISVIIRASGESVNAQLGDELLPGDTLITSSNSSVIVAINNHSPLGNSRGFALVGEIQTVTFDVALFDRIESLLPQSSLSNLIHIGKTPPPEWLNIFADSNEQNTNTVIEEPINLEEAFSAPSAGIPPLNTTTNNGLLVESIVSIRSNLPETIPENASTTTENSAIDDIDNVESNTQEDSNNVLTNRTNTATLLPPTIDTVPFPNITDITSTNNNEGEELVYSVTLSNAFTSDISFSFDRSDGSVSTADTNNTLTFSNGVILTGSSINVPAGVSEFTVSVSTIDDNLEENNETLDIVIDGVRSTGTIIDNDLTPTIATISTASATEGDALAHTVTLSNPSINSTSFAFSLTANTAATTDFTNTPTFSNGVILDNGFITVPAGVSSFTVTITSIEDGEDENDESIDLIIGGVSATSTIIDNDTSAVIGGNDTETLTEDRNINASQQLVASGSLTIVDPDAGEAHFIGTAITGTYGTLTIDTSGHWTYIADNNQGVIQTLTPSDQLTETLTVASIDGTTHDITVLINGVNITATDNAYTSNENNALAGNVILNSISDNDDVPNTGNIITTGLTLHYDAASDTNNNGVWENTSPTPPSTDFVWDLDPSGNFTPNTVTSALTGITEAYRFNVNPGDSTGAQFSDLSGDDDSFESIAGNPSNNSASFELWFRAADTSDHDVLFETGATGDGVALNINGTVVEFFVKDGSANVLLNYDLATIGVDPTSEFVQLVGVITVGGTVSLYVNGTLASQDTSGVINDWAGSNDGGLGINNEGINFNSPTAFEGEIASFNFYETALPNASVAHNYQAIAGFSVTQVNGTPISLNSPISLDNGSLIMAADGSYQYTPNTGFKGVETFTYTIGNNNGETDTATVSINVINPDAPVITVVANDLTEESVSVGDVVANFTASDPTNDPLTFQILNNSDGYFALNGNTVQLTSAGVSAINNDTLNLLDLDITVEASDGALQTSATDNSQITRVNEAPAISLTALDITEEMINSGDVIATFTSSDPENDSLTYALLNNSDGYFVINGNNVELTPTGVTAINDDTLDLSSVTITVEASDGDLSASASDTSIITRDNDDNAPTIAVTAVDVTEEAVSVGDVMATFTANDVDGQTLSYRLLNNNDGYFTLNGTNVELTAAGVSAINDDNLNLNNLTITVEASDGGLQSSASDTSIITRVNDDAPVINVTAVDVTEESVTNGDTIATFTASDPNGDSLTYQLLNNTDNYFVLNGNTVELTSDGVNAINDDVLNLNSLNITVEANDGTFQTSASSNSNIIRVNDNAPTIGGINSAAITEDTNLNGAGNIIVSGTLTISDLDVGEDSFVAASELTGTGNFGTLNIDTAGNWIYTADNSSSALQALTPNDTVIDTVTVTTADGTSQAINISVTGTNITALDNDYTVNEESAITGNLISDQNTDNDDTLSSTAVITSDLLLHYDAAADNSNNGTWENTSATPPSTNYAWSFTPAGNVTPHTVTSALPGITEAYRFNVNPGDITGAEFSDLSGDDDSFSNIPTDPTNDSATFELWFRAADINDHDVLFEVGATGDGASLRMNGTVVEFFVKDGNANVQLSFDLATVNIDPTEEFVQVAGVITDNGNVDLYINGALAAQDTSGVISDWAGSNDAGLGFNNEGINFNSPTAFEGDIALFNFYESALSSSDVLDNYQSIAGFSISQVDGNTISLNTPITLNNGSIIIAGDGSYQYTPNTGFNGLETFSYTIENHNGDTDTATVTINVANPITGSTNDNTLNGTLENDVLSGDIGNDILIGNAGIDILFGGIGADTLTGGTGGDTFVWASGDADNSTDRITDFSLGTYGVGESDRLNLSDLLQGETRDTLSDYLNVIDDGTDVSITVDVNGTGGDNDLTLVLEGLGTGVINLQTLVDNQQIMFDL